MHPYVVHKQIEDYKSDQNYLYILKSECFLNYFKKCFNSVRVFFDLFLTTISQRSVTIIHACFQKDGRKMDISASRFDNETFR